MFHRGGKPTQRSHQAYPPPSTLPIESVYYANGANGGPGTATLPAGGILSGTTVTRIDFQTAAAPTPTGYAPDTGEAFAPQGDGLSYGWSGSGQPDTTEYTSEPLQQYNGNDNIQPMGQSAGTWTLNLPNGTYPVAVVMGDAGRRDMTNNVAVGGVLCTDPAPDTVGETQGYEAGRFVGYAVNVTVSNGSLTVTASSGAVNPRICFIEVGAEGKSIDSATQARLAYLTQTMTEATAGTPPKLATRAHVYGSYIDEPLLYVNNGTKYYIHSNDLYSVAALTDQTGAVVEQYTYDAYGRQTVKGPDGTVRTASSYGEPWGFTGRRNDAETGLMYFRARMYSPGLGRFVGRDPSGYKSGPNLYESFYIPNGEDPTGLTDIKIGFWGAAMDGTEAWATDLKATGAMVYTARQIGDAVDYILKELDTSKDGKYDKCDLKNGKQPKSIGIVGYSWGGYSAYGVLAYIGRDHRFVLKPKAYIGTLDPVSTGRSALRSGGTALTGDFFTNQDAKDLAISTVNYYELTGIDGSRGSGAPGVPNSAFHGNSVPWASPNVDLTNTESEPGYTFDHIDLGYRDVGKKYRQAVLDTLNN